MIEIRILNASPSRLRSLLGDLARGLDLKGGDTRIVCETEGQVAVGRGVFEALLTKGWAGYAVGTGEAGGRRKMDSFDPCPDERVVLFGPIAGGR